MQEGITVGLNRCLERDKQLKAKSSQESLDLTQYSSTLEKYDRRWGNWNYEHSVIEKL